MNRINNKLWLIDERYLHNKTDKIEIALISV